MRRGSASNTMPLFCVVRGGGACGHRAGAVHVGCGVGRQVGRRGEPGERAVGGAVQRVLGDQVVVLPVGLADAERQRVLQDGGRGAGQGVGELVGCHAQRARAVGVLLADADLRQDELEVLLGEVDPAGSAGMVLCAMTGDC